MAEVQAVVEKIHEIREHPNADRLEIAVIGGEGGYQCCVQKDQFKPGDKCVYFPVDSVLPEYLLQRIFGTDPKVYPSKGRIKTIRLRGAISQGLAVPISRIGEFCGYSYITEGARVGLDVTKLYGITKYEPPQKGSPTSKAKPSTPKNINPNFDKYTDVQHLKKYPEVLKGMRVMVMEKIHGTNFRAGKVPVYRRGFFHRLLKFFGFKKDYEFVYGSHNVQLQGKYKGKDFYSRQDNVDVYTKTAKNYMLPDILEDGEVIYGEIYGDRIQKGYTYGCAEGEHRLVVFDVKVDGKFLNATNLINFCHRKGLPMAPILYNGDFYMTSMDLLVSGASELNYWINGANATQPVREGIVVRAVPETTCHAGRMIFKYINPEYLLKDDENTEYH